MKKIFLLMIFAVFSTALIAEKAYGDFVITNDGVYYFKNVRSGIAHFLVCKKADGEKVTFKQVEVLAYSVDGQRFEKMPVLKKNKLTDDFAFMRVLSYKNGLKLYEYKCCDLSGEELAAYFIFKNEKFVVDVNSRNFESIKEFYKGGK